MNDTLKRTSLYEVHQKLGGKIVPFAGWELPVQYSGVVAEHQAVREKAGLFDVSHMGEIVVSGPEALQLLQNLTCNDLSTLYDGKAQYSALLNEQGGVIDDIIVYREGPENFFVCVNASNSDIDFAWMTKQNNKKATVKNVSAEYGQIALQGPKAIEILGQIQGGDQFTGLQTFHFARGTLLNIPVMVARTGYTGEDGVEVFVPWNKTVELWNALLAAGNSYGLIPCGLGARDSLRLEACLPLHGHELSPDLSALSSGLGWIVKFDKGEFIGKAALLKQKNEGLAQKLIGFFIDEAGIARQGDAILSKGGERVGAITSGTKTPTVNRALGLAVVKASDAELNTPIFCEVRGRKLAAHVVKRPFYIRSK